MSNSSIKQVLIDRLSVDFPDNLNQEINAGILRDYLQEFINTVVVLLSTNEIGFGNETVTGDKVVYFEKGDTNEPAIRYNVTSSKFEFSNDGVAFQEFGTGGIGALTDGSVVFFDSGAAAEDNVQLFWDNTNKRFGNGINTPTAKQHIVGREDINQLLVKAHTTQTSSVKKIVDSSDNELWSIEVNGDSFQRGTNSTPTPKSDGFIRQGKDYDGTPATMSPVFICEDGLPLNVRYAAENPITITFSEFLNNYDFSIPNGNLINILDIVYDDTIVTSFNIAAVTHGATEKDSPAYEPTITSAITRQNAIDDLNAWINGNNLIDGNAYTSPVSNEYFSLRISDVVISGDYEEADISIIIYKQ